MKDQDQREDNKCLICHEVSQREQLHMHRRPRSYGTNTRVVLQNWRRPQIHSLRARLPRWMLGHVVHWTDLEHHHGRHRGRQHVPQLPGRGLQEARSGRRLAQSGQEVNAARRTAGGPGGLWREIVAL